LQKHQAGEKMAAPQSSCLLQQQEQQHAQQLVQLPQQDMTHWECHKCTALNLPLAQVCSVCNAARVHVQPAMQQPTTSRHPPAKSV
jgi:hypothetical protein